jgi:hypothetical protein
VVGSVWTRLCGVLRSRTIESKSYAQRRHCQQADAALEFSMASLL